MVYVGRKEFISNIFEQSKGMYDVPVFHKQDGQRFEDMTTVKLNADTKYNIKLITRPANTIR